MRPSRNESCVLVALMACVSAAHASGASTGSRSSDDEPWWFYPMVVAGIALVLFCAYLRLALLCPCLPLPVCCCRCRAAPPERAFPVVPPIDYSGYAPPGCVPEGGAGQPVAVSGPGYVPLGAGPTAGARG